MTLYLQQILGLSAIEAGLVYLPGTMLNFLVAGAIANVGQRVSPHVLVAAGLALVGAGQAVLTVVGVGLRVVAVPARPARRDGRHRDLQPGGQPGRAELGAGRAERARRRGQRHVPPGRDRGRHRRARRARPGGRGASARARRSPTSTASGTRYGSAPWRRVVAAVATTMLIRAPRGEQAACPRRWRSRRAERRRSGASAGGRTVTALMLAAAALPATLLALVRSSGRSRPCSDRQAPAQAAGAGPPGGLPGAAVATCACSRVTHVDFEGAARHGAAGSSTRTPRGRWRGSSTGSTGCASRSATSRLHDAYGPRRDRPADGDISGSFECRQAVPSPCTGGNANGSWSNHAFGLAVDLNPSRTRTPVRPEPRPQGQPVPGPLPAPTGDGHSEGRRGVRLGRLGLGRSVDRQHEGLHALLDDRASARGEPPTRAEVDVAPRAAVGRNGLRPALDEVPPELEVTEKQRPSNRRLRESGGWAPRVRGGVDGRQLITEQRQAA